MSKEKRRDHLVGLTDLERATIDAARGKVPRARWMRDAALARAAIPGIGAVIEAHHRIVSDMLALGATSIVTRAEGSDLPPSEP